MKLIKHPHKIIACIIITAMLLILKPPVVPQAAQEISFSETVNELGQLIRTYHSYLYIAYYLDGGYNKYYEISVVNTVTGEVKTTPIREYHKSEWDYWYYLPNASSESTWFILKRATVAPRGELYPFSDDITSRCIKVNGKYSNEIWQAYDKAYKAEHSPVATPKPTVEPTQAPSQTKAPVATAKPVATLKPVEVVQTPEPTPTPFLIPDPVEEVIPIETVAPASTTVHSVDSNSPWRSDSTPAPSPTQEVKNVGLTSGVISDKYMKEIWITLVILIVSGVIFGIRKAIKKSKHNI